MLKAKETLCNSYGGIQSRFCNALWIIPSDGGNKIGLASLSTLLKWVEWYNWRKTKLKKKKNSNRLINSVQFHFIRLESL